MIPTGHVQLSDDLGRIIELGHTPRRIVSLVPSITLTLFDLGCGSSVVGRTKFCIHPAEKVKEVPVVGGTKKIHVDKVVELNPDLVIANKEENTLEDIEKLDKKLPVFITDISNLDDNKRLLFNLGILLNAEEKAAQIQQKIGGGFSTLNVEKTIPALYVIWKDPFMSIGHDTFIHEVMNMAGFANIFSAAKRYPEFTLEEIKQLNPEVILLSSEPYPFKEQHLMEFQKAFPSVKVLLVDGEMFSWYGSKMTEAPMYLNRLRSSIS